MRISLRCRGKSITSSFGFPSPLAERCPRSTTARLEGMIQAPRFWYCDANRRAFAECGAFLHQVRSNPRSIPVDQWNASPVHITALRRRKSCLGASGDEIREIGRVSESRIAKVRQRLSWPQNDAIGATKRFFESATGHSVRGASRGCSRTRSEHRTLCEPTLPATTA